MQYQINLGIPFWQFDYEQVKRIEPEAVYVADLAIYLTKGKRWSAHPVSVFYTPRPRVEYTNNYFGLFRVQPSLAERSPEWSICDATSVTEHEWDGLERNGEVIFSRWAHDFRTFKDGGPYVDGGPEYLRVVYDYEQLQLCNDVKLKIVDGKFEVAVTKTRTV